jgi:ligand-binding SRPBCC domain-containing protein
MKYHHRFRVNAPLAEVISFHRQATNMGAITPPPIRVKIHQAPAELSSSDEMDFSLHLGPFQIRWLALIENMTEAGFTDRQLQGTFLTWNHRHSFNPIEASVTEVDDQVTAEVKRSLGEGFLGWVLWLGMPFLFAYRGWKTRSLLEGRLDADR